MEKGADIKVSENDMNTLKNHVRLMNGLPLIEEPLKSTSLLPPPPSSSSFPTAAETAVKTAWSSSSTPPPQTASISNKSRRRRSTLPSIAPRSNQTYFYRTECVKKRLRQLAKTSRFEANEIQKMRAINLQKKTADYFKLNKAFHVRWKNIRGLPVVHSHFRDTFIDTGKPPFVVPVHYKPFNVYWDADWAKQEFIFLDAAAEEKKKEEAKKKEEERKKEEQKKLSHIIDAAPFKPKFNNETVPKDAEVAESKEEGEKSENVKP